MNFCWVTLHVNNLEESLKFYHDLLGLKISSRYSSGGEAEIAMLGETDYPKVELLCNKHIKVDQPGQGVSIGFTVDSLDETMAFMKENQIRITLGPIAPSPNVRFFFVNDPDGYEVQFVEMKH